MSDAPGDDAAAAAAAAAEAATAAAAAAATPDWRDGWPDELKNDPGLANYDSAEKMARGLLDTKALVGRDKIVLPKGDDDADGWAALWAAAGRPAEAKDYQIDIPEGAPPEFAEAFRGIAHQAGLSGKQVGELVKFNNEFVAKAEKAMFDKGQAELDAWKQEVGADVYADIAKKSREAAKAFGVADAIVDELETKLGSRGMINHFYEVGKRMGEHGRLNPGDPLVGISADPLAERSALQKDPEFQAKIAANDPEALKRYRDLNAAIAAKAQGS